VAPLAVPVRNDASVREFGRPDKAAVWRSIACSTMIIRRATRAHISSS
jgi:hypothetical protein